MKWDNNYHYDKFEFQVCLWKTSIFSNFRSEYLLKKLLPINTSILTLVIQWNTTSGALNGQEIRKITDLFIPINNEVAWVAHTWLFMRNNTRRKTFLGHISMAGKCIPTSNVFASLMVPPHAPKLLGNKPQVLQKISYQWFVLNKLQYTPIKALKNSQFSRRQQ